MNALSEKMRAALARIARGDSALASELNDRRRNFQDIADARVINELAAAGAAAVPPDDPAFVAETIVLRVGRPVLAIKYDEAELTFRDAESEVWRQRLTAARIQLAAAAKAVGRVEVVGHHQLAWLGTGWLVAPDIIVTNRHVAMEFGRWGGDKFVFKNGATQRDMSASIDFLEEFGRDAEQAEFTLNEILHIEDENGPDLAFLRVKPGRNALATEIALADSEPVEGLQVAVIGYPARDSRIPDQALMRDIFGDVYDKKRLAPGQVTASPTGLLQHDCSTLGGNSGSVVLDITSGRAVGLHFAGRFLKANFAVPANVVAHRLAQVAGGERIAPRTRSPAANLPAGATNSSPTGGNRISFTLPVRLTIDVGNPIFDPAPIPPATANGPDGSRRSASAVHSQPVADDADVQVTSEARVEDYKDRQGYEPMFLGTAVPLPDIIRNQGDVLVFETDTGRESELRYHHYSIKMNAPRRLCILSAVNIDGKLSKKTKRPGWRTDPRIPKAQQILKECYGNPPMYSRGHMTRREDPAWGDQALAEAGNADSMHVTNTVPQKQPFNAGIWLALEDYALQNARKDDMRISVFTGPFLKPDDTTEFGVRIPVSFWKVIAFIHDKTGRLCATGYTMSQQAFLNEDEFVFGKHESTQTSIAAIAEEAGLSFGLLAGLDPFQHLPEARGAVLVDPRQISYY